MRLHPVLLLLVLAAACGSDPSASNAPPPAPPPPPPPSPQPPSPPPAPATVLAGSVSIQAGSSQENAPSTSVVIPPTVLVKDSQGQPLPGALVRFQVDAGGGSTDRDTVRTGADGTVSVAWRLGPLPGPNRLLAIVDTVSPAVFTATGRFLVATSMVPGVLVLPSGSAVVASGLRVRSPMIDVPVGEFARFTAPVEPGEPSLSAATREDGTPYLFAWLDDRHGIMSPRTTAEVMAFFDLGGYLFESETDRDKLRAGLRLADLRILEDAITAALQGNPSSSPLESAQLKHARAKAVQLLTTPKFAKSVLIEPPPERSGITLDQTGFRNIILTNTFRRRVVAFVDRVSSTDKQGATSEAILNGPPIKLGAVIYVTSAPGALADLASGDPVTEPVVSAPVPVPLFPADAAKTRYRVTAVGTGLPTVLMNNLPGYMKDAQAEAALETLLLDAIIPIVKTVFNVNGLAKNNPLGLDSEALYSKLVGINPAEAINLLRQGDFEGAFREMLKRVFDSKEGQDLIFDALAGPYQLRVGFKGEGWDKLVKGWTSAQRALTIVEVGGTGFAILKTFLDHLASSQAEQWYLDVTAAEVRLTPPSATISQLETQFFKAIVTDATGGNGPVPVFHYHWSTSGTVGKICNAANSSGQSCGTEFVSSGDGVTYLPEGTKAGTDQIKVRVTMVVDGQEIDVGEAQAAVTTYQSKVSISPESVTINPGGSASFTVTFEGYPDPAAGRIFRWSTPGQLGLLSASGVRSTGIEVTNRQTMEYVSTPDQFGNDREGVEPVRVTVQVIGSDGNRVSLGFATATVEVKKRNPDVISGSWFITDPIPADAGRSCIWAYIRFPLVEGATRYALYAHDFNDTLFWGTQINSILTPPFPALAAFGPRVSGASGGEYFFFLTGGCGPDSSIPEGIASMAGRFAGMVVDVTVFR
jgi:hypothetical protein